MSSIPPVNRSGLSEVKASRVNWKGIAKVDAAATRALSGATKSGSSLRTRSGKQQTAPLKTVQGQIHFAAASHLQGSGRRIHATHMQ